MTPIKSNRAPLTKRISALAITAAAAVSFAILSPEAQAAPAKPTKEYLALDAALKQVTANPNATVETATPQQLADAIIQANQNSVANNTKLKPGNIAGEALKYSGDETAGDEILTALADVATDDLASVTDAIKRAGSGKDINVRLVPGFAAAFLPDGLDDSPALALAKRVISSKAGAGAVIGGRALDIAQAAGAQQAEIETLVNNALAKTAKLTAAAQDIAKYAAAQLSLDGGSTAELARDVSLANLALATKVSVGAVAGDPTNGGPIIDAVLSEANLPKLKSGVAPLVKGAATVADIEEISHIAVAVGKQIATANGSKTSIPFAKATSIVKTLASAIVAKSTAAGGPINNAENKEDEIGEVVAFMVGQILNPLTVNGANGGKPQVTIKNAGPKIYSIILAALNTTKSNKVRAGNPQLYEQLTVDLPASVAETLGALRDFYSEDVIPDGFFDAIKTFIKSKAKTLAGNAGTQTAIETNIDAAYASGDSALFENGAPANVAEATNRDETDFRPF